MTTVALEITLRHHTDDARVDAVGGDAMVTASTRSAHADRADAIDAAAQLLRGLLMLGYRLRGGLVGATRTDDGRWHGRLVEVFLAPAEDAQTPFAA